MAAEDACGEALYGMSVSARGKMGISFCGNGLISSQGNEYALLLSAGSPLLAVSLLLFSTHVDPFFFYFLLCTLWSVSLPVSKEVVHVEYSCLFLRVHCVEGSHCQLFQDSA